MTKVEIEVVVDVPYASYREDSRETMTVREDRFWAFTLAVTFGFSAGYVDANTKRRFATFGSLMTGNAVQLGTAAAGGDWHEAALCASTFVAFDVGLMATSHIIHLATRDSSRESLVSPKPHGSRDGQLETRLRRKRRHLPGTQVSCSMCCCIVRWLMQY